MTSEECNDFPEIKKYLATNGIQYQIERLIYRNKDGKKYRNDSINKFKENIGKVEDLCSGSKQNLAYLVELLYNRGKLVEAKNIMVRHKLECVAPKVIQRLSKVPISNI